MNVQPISINTSFGNKGSTTVNPEMLLRAQQRVQRLQEKINRQAGLNIKYIEHKPGETAAESARIDLANAWGDVMGALGMAMNLLRDEHYKNLIKEIREIAQKNNYKHLEYIDGESEKIKKFKEFINAVIDAVKAHDIRTKPSEANGKGV